MSSYCASGKAADRAGVRGVTLDGDSARGGGCDGVTKTTVTFRYQTQVGVTLWKILSGTRFCMIQVCMCACIIILCRITCMCMYVVSAMCVCIIMCVCMCKSVRERERERERERKR